MKFLKTKQGALIGIVSAIIVAIVLWWFFAYVAYAPEPEETADSLITTKELKINNTELTVEVAESLEDRAKGLSSREELGENKGMFFVFEQSDFHRFWMKDMNFPIDIMWIDGEFIIIDLRENVLPETFPESFGPKAPAKYVLETNAGFVEEYSIGVGDKVEIDL